MFRNLVGLLIASVVLASFALAQNADAPPKQLRIRVSPGVSQSFAQKRVLPEYPADALTAGDHGKVIVKVSIGTDGKVTEASVLSGPASLQAVGKAAAEQFEFRPYLLNGQPVMVETTIRFIFSYKGSGSHRKGKVEFDTSAG